ncbi:MAG: Stk1 family PASTA domain-containing Ser/Thr kinase [Anaerovoracaceae bacterium]|nr:Stk1 family PASTA domain-containing Ser/Thr kinase [Anaerovoracaceae bacterium]
MSNKLLAGRYELIEKIGEGGMAVVYKGKDRLLNRYVAIKILRPEYTKDEQFIESFRRESQAAAGLSHPNIVGVYDVGKEGNIHFIVMELIDGKTLSEVIKEKGRLEYKEAINITLQVASALSLAHKNQIIHRDIKPHNILITSTGVAKLADFGIAKAVSAATIAGGSNKIMGSVHYFSPEQARGAYVDERSDIYSLGIVLFEMLTGKVPFDGDNPVSIALMHINDPMPSLTKEVPGVPPQLEKIVNKATEKYQSNRYRNVDEMISDLEDIEFVTKVIGKNAFAVEDNSSDASQPKQERKNGEEAPVPARKERQRNERSDSSKDKNKMTLFIVIGVVIVAIAALIGLGSMLGWFGGSDEITVPNFVGKTLEEATAEAEEKGLVIQEGDLVFSPDQEEGFIASQNPASGSKVTEGKVITVNISKGKKDGVVPKIEGMDYDEAKEYLESFGFKMGPGVTVDSPLPKGIIVSQSVPYGTQAKSGTEINVEISNGKGKEMVKVPNLIGRTPDEANSLLSQAGLSTNGSVVYEEVEGMAQNLVFWQSIAADTEVEKGTAVDYKVSKGTKPEGSGSGDPDMDIDPDYGGDE